MRARPGAADTGARGVKLAAAPGRTNSRRTPMQTKLLQLAALMASRHLFGAEQDREEGVRLVRERWGRLRQALGG